MSLFEVVEDKGDNIILILGGADTLEEAQKIFKSKSIFHNKEKMNIIICIENLDLIKKQGALEELKRIEEAWHHIGSKGVCNYIQKRIKELEEEGV